MRNIEFADSTSKKERYKIKEYYRKLKKRNKNKKRFYKKPPINYAKGLSYSEFLNTK